MRYICAHMDDVWCGGGSMRCVCLGSFGALCHQNGIEVTEEEIHQWCAISALAGEMGNNKKIRCSGWYNCLKTTIIICKCNLINYLNHSESNECYFQKKIFLPTLKIHTNDRLLQLIRLIYVVFFWMRNASLWCLAYLLLLFFLGEMKPQMGFYSFAKKIPKMQIT